MEQKKLDPQFERELDDAAAAYGVALSEWENLNRRKTAALCSFEPIFWKLAAGVERHQSGAVCNVLKEIAEQVEPGAVKCTVFPDLYRLIRGWYLDGAPETDREKTAKELKSNTLYRMQKHFSHRKGVAPPALDANEVKESYRQYLKVPPWTNEDAAALGAAAKKARETKMALDALETKAREIERANGLSAAAKAHLEKIDVYRSRAERLFKDADSIERGESRLSREIRKAVEESTSKSDTEPSETAGAKAQGRFVREVEQTEKNQYHGKQTTLLDGQYRGRVW